MHKLSTICTAPPVLSCAITARLQKEFGLKGRYCYCRRRMSTVPLLSLCVQDMVVLRGRRFHVRPSTSVTP